MSELYPQIEPFEHGMLEVRDGHSIYWESVREPGRAVRPWCCTAVRGSGRSTRMRRVFDPDRTA